MTEGTHIRVLSPTDAPEYRELMLDAYALHPESFTSSAAERAALPMMWWTQRLSDAPDASQIVLGAFDRGRLVGAAGVTFEAREKSRHKADLFGMYVADASRKHGFGRGLVEAVLACAAAREGVELVQLTVTQGNDAAQKLYANCGFEVFGTEPFAVKLDGRYLSKVHMWRWVRAATET